MRTVRKLIFGEVLSAIGFVALAFLALFVFFDLVDELPALGRASPLDASLRYGMPQALLYVGLLVPSRLYELLPIAVLIGSVYGLVRLAQGSEFTILRTSGLGPWRALQTMLWLGAGFVVLTVAIGDYLAPWADRQGQLLKATYQGRISVGQTGAWLKERGDDRQISVNVRAMDARGELEGVRIFEFDDDGRIRQTVQAASATVDNAAGLWRLRDVRLREFVHGTQAPQTRHSTPETLDWPTTLTTDMIAVALLKPERMRTADLFRYIRHLEANNQTAQRYEIEFWRKVFYPLSCLVMVVLALPFAYLHFRAKGLAAYVFAGVMIGISFFLLNNVFGYIGNLRNWEPWLASAAPSLLYSLASLGAFGWLVLKR
ncbi:LPS export ABC transporter permease LptG [Tepidicella xavieri]|jgi:lipopolysaccharide export system permease protein|uniref:Lipopolysaccharide export system permease protein n=1 Tax=Tepidicella xavieri TaxID=360241 RepID=A0A4R6UBM6_9BURK|nr:LPS export ABC transporter permease LptG [Tepidicella xavieri]TDQ44060.1 lipopolysaccharide export system permease protein [Tepidicella xavieri]